MRKTEYVVYTESFQFGKYSDALEFHTFRNYTTDDIADVVLNLQSRDSKELSRWSTLEEALSALKDASVDSYVRGGTLFGNIAFVEEEVLEFDGDEWDVVDRMGIWEYKAIPYSAYEEDE